MNFLSRALTSLTRNPLKTLLLLLIVFILAVVISGAISVQQAIQNTDSNLRHKLPPVVSINYDNDGAEEHMALTGSWPEWTSPSTETLLEIAALPQVRNYDILSSKGLFSTDLEFYIPEGAWPWSAGMGDWEVFWLKGVSRPDFVDLEEGIIEITSGRSFTQEETQSLSYVTLISEEFAQLNNLNLGSTIRLYEVIWDYEGLKQSLGDGTYTWEHDESFYIEENILSQRAYDFEVIGIFRSNAEFNIDRHHNDIRKTEQLNRFYIPNQVIHGEHQVYFENAVYVLNDSREIEEFRVAAEALLPDFWIVADASDAFAKFESSMASIVGLAEVALWVAVAASIIILSLLIVLLLRERKREIGVYLALGEQRTKVIAQMLTEVVVVALLAIVLALFVGNFLAEALSESMLKNDMIARQNAGDLVTMITPLDDMGFGLANVLAEEALLTYSVTLDAATIGLFFIFALSSVVIATILPMLYIVRLNPKKIML